MANFSTKNVGFKSVPLGDNFKKDYLFELRKINKIERYEEIDYNQFSNDSTDIAWEEKNELKKDPLTAYAKMNHFIYPDTKVKMPLYSQHDKEWEKNKYGTTTISNGGCGITSMAMIISYITSIPTPPNEIVTLLDSMGGKEENWYYCPNVGSYHTIFPELANFYGYKCNQVYENINMELIKTELAKGNYVILAIASGPIYKGNGHFIVIREIDKLGNIYINDPNINSVKGDFFDLNKPYQYDDLGTITSMHVILSGDE